MNLEERLKAAGIEISPEFNVGVIRHGNQFFAGTTTTIDGHEVRYGSFGDWGRDIFEKFSDANGAAETKEFKAAIEAQAKLIEEAKHKRQEEVALECETAFATFSERGTSLYLQRKLISDLFGARLAPNQKGSPVLVVPLRDIDGKFWNYQLIYDKKLERAQTNKIFVKGGRKNECFHTIRVGGASEGVHESTMASPTPTEIYVAEGFATAASIATALRGHARDLKMDILVCAAFDAGNLQAVATVLRSKFSLARIVLCADNDAFTEINGKPVNIGINKARLAAGAAKGELVYPSFKHPAKGFTDFNDLHAAEGLEVVTDQLLHPEKYRVGISEMILPLNKNGNPIPPKERDVVDHVLKEYGSKLIKFRNLLFSYNQTHWQEFEHRDHDRLKAQIAFAGGGLGSRETMNVYNQLMFRVEHTPPGVEMYQPNPSKANFLNGTLHVEPGEPITFLKHDKGDWCTRVLPFDCPDLNSPPKPTPMFDSWCARMWPDPKEREQNTALSFELMAAAIAPRFPIIALFIGKTNSGKSTLIKLIIKLVSEANTCSVQPSMMKGFSLASMINKLVNYDTDLDRNTPFNDSMVKKLIDRLPVEIDRKHKDKVHGLIPVVHVFAANGLPPTLDGESKAYKRRITIVRADQSLIEGTETKEFANILWESEKEALLSRAIEALKRLHQSNGVFTKPSGSDKMVEEMEVNSDPVDQFLELTVENEIHDTEGILKIDKSQDKLSIQRTALWNKFFEWQKAAGIPPFKVVSSRKFHQRMRSEFRVGQPTQGIRHYFGIGWVNRLTGQQEVAALQQGEEIG